MHFVVIGRDRNRGELRRRHRGDHLDYVAGHQDKFVFAGPLIEEEGPVGSLFVFDVGSRAELDAYCANDPYFASVFGSVEIFESRSMVPEPESGLLAAEAARSRTDME